MQFFKALSGFLIGVINSAIGAGGGMICVPAMKKTGLSQKEAQATTLAVILALTVISTAVYAFKGYFSPRDAFKYIPFGFLGSVLGVRLTEKADSRVLKRLFAVFMLWSGIRMIFR